MPYVYLTMRKLERSQEAIAPSIVFLAAVVIIALIVYVHDSGPQPIKDGSISRLLRGWENFTKKQLEEKTGTRQLNQNLVLLKGVRQTCFGSLINADIVLTSAQCSAILKANDTA
jgi:hypothetical protein